MSRANYSTWVLILCGVGAVLATGCATVEPVGVPGILEPLNEGNWDPNLAVLPYANFEGNTVTVHNVRDTEYTTELEYEVRHHDKTFELGDLESVDFILVPFREKPYIAHTMLSFGLSNGEFLAVSAEVRLEKDEEYSLHMGLLRQFELTYVVAEERDVIRLRTRHRDADVYVYRTIATPEQTQELFVDVMKRVNKLALDPEFYDLITNNCTTNIVRHINKLHRNRVPLGMPVLLPGLADRYAFDLGLLDSKVSFKETKRRAHVNHLAELHYDSADFSGNIRR